MTNNSDDLGRTMKRASLLVVSSVHSDGVAHNHFEILNGLDRRICVPIRGFTVIGMWDCFHDNKKQQLTSHTDCDVTITTIGGKRPFQKTIEGNTPKGEAVHCFQL